MTQPPNAACCSTTQIAHPVPPFPPTLAIAIYLVYLGLSTTESFPLFAQINWMHEGERMGTVQIVLSGGLPIRDVYTPHGLFPEVIRPLVAFWLFGESLVSDRLLGLFLAPLAYVVAAVYLWRLFSTRFWRVVALVGFALFPLQILPRHLVVFLTLLTLTGWFRDGNQRHLFRAGLIAGFGYVIGTIDQTTFLLAALAALPVALASEQALRRWVVLPSTDPVRLTTGNGFFRVALPLYKGILLGMLPFAGYLAVTGTASIFVTDLIRRGEADAYAFSHVLGYQSYPVVSLANAVWYAVPIFYVGLGLLVAWRAGLRGDRRWSSIWPTLLFGLFSFVYAVRHPNYWKLAVVAFPFIVGLVFVFSMLFDQQAQDKTHENGWSGIMITALFGATLALMAMVLIEALTRDWKPKEIAPRYLFPLLAVLVAGGASLGRWGKLHTPQMVKALMVASPLAAVIVAVWLFNEAQPQLVGALTRKPRLAGDVVRLIGASVTTGGRFTREQPPYVQDETLAYLKTASLEHRQVVMLAPGAGIYYFLAGLAPPNRFPEINITLADRWAQEVVEGLDRTRAELLVACNDNGRQMGAWPIKPVLAEYIASHYADSGRQLTSEMSANCPFSVWTYRTPA